MFFVRNNQIQLSIDFPDFHEEKKDNFNIHYHCRSSSVEQQKDDVFHDHLQHSYGYICLYDHSSHLLVYKT